MSPTRIFRPIFLAANVLAILGTFMDTLIPGLIPPALHEAYKASFATAPFSNAQALLAVAFILVFFVGGIIVDIGLYLYKPWGRRYSLWLSLAALLVYPFLGDVLRSSWANAFIEASMMLWGATLALAYFSDVRDKFEPSREPSP